jgi:superfamily I DNA/RNA helicase/mRNA-degrading endonuclease YafQ of YafQ-DinJ toxin-antitoxin module
MPEVVVSDEFLEQFDALTAEKQKQTLKAIRLLADNPRHPSLNAHQLDGLRGNFWDCYVSVGANAHRIIYEPDGSLIKLWKVGDHSVIDRAASLSFAANTQFRRMGEPEQEKSEPKPFEIPAEWLTPRSDREPNNPFAYLPAAHLRILGVPAALVKAVKTVPYLEDVERIPGLPEHSVSWLLELATNARLERIAFDEGRLIFRTTLDQLEGYVEGRIKRLMLNLTPDQQQYIAIQPTKPVLLRGCAGSGKTTVGVYRAINLAETGAKVIFLTFNRVLAAAARTLIEELVGPLPDNLQVIHLDSWAAQFLQDRTQVVDIINDDDRSALIKTALASVRETTPHVFFEQPWTFFRDEIAFVIKGNGIGTEAEYLSIPRYGRKTPLNAASRRLVWLVYEAYEQALKPRMDWQDLALKTYHELVLSSLDSPFDHVVVDEVQDLSAMQLRVIQRLIKGGKQDRPRSIFLVGDIAQTIYTRGFTWEQAGLQLRGNSFSIRRNFRNTREIAEAAALLNSYNQVVRTSEFYVDPEFTQRHGPYPILLECDISDRERRAVCEKILSLVEDQEFRLSDFAIVAPAVELCEQYRMALEQANVPSAIYTQDSFNILEEQVKVMTIHSAKGLEFPVVFIVGLHVNVLPRRISVSDPEEQTLQLERERTLFYVGMTRAAEALYLVTSKQQPSRFLQEIIGTIRRETYAGGKS